MREENRTGGGAAPAVESDPISFYLLRSDTWFGTIGLLVFLVVGAFMVYVAVDIALDLEVAGGVALVATALLVSITPAAVMVIMMRRSRRDGTMVIDPVRGEIRVGRARTIPFSEVRTIAVVDYEYTHRGQTSDFTPYEVDSKARALDIGGGNLLCAQADLSEARIREIAKALEVRVNAYRERTGEGIAPLPPPDLVLLRRMAGSLHGEGQAFDPEWLSLDGWVAQSFREDYDSEPDAASMEVFAMELRKAGYDLGDGVVAEPPPELGDLED